MTDVLVSEKNPLLKQVRRAVARGSLTEDGLAVSEGFHLLAEAMESHCEIPAVIVAESARESLSSHAKGLKRTRVMPVRDSVFADLASTETPQGVLSLVRPPEWTLDQLLRGRSLVIVLDGVQDPGNAGAILRAAEAFGATGVAFLKGTVSPYNPKCLRASAGSVYRVPLLAAADEKLFLAALVQHNIALYAAMPRAGKLIGEVDFEARCAIVIGSEGRGVSPRLQTPAIGIKIPTSGVESLNAAVAAGVVLYEACRQRSGGA